MNKNIVFFLFVVFFAHNFILGQVKVSGRVVDENKEPIPFANVIFKGTSKGTVSDEKGAFYIEAEKYFPELEVSFLGFEKQIIPLKERNFDLVIVLKEDAAVLNEVTIYTGRVKNKDNPAVAILKKVWENKRRNGIYLYNQYEFSKYEKIEFDLNNIDEKLMTSRVFKGMEFVFEQVDTSNITGKPYLPIFINESSIKFTEQILLLKNTMKNSWVIKTLVFRITRDSLPL
ncbi:MAG: carboxypeptidase-like regulatory domain-containing protein [Flavobacteriaceae bacterium]|nr:carboxypeptidase-like regulatory domain-containing protein [Flavobacteriaceae bacterium]